MPNIGVRTLWGLSGLRVLNLSRNNLTNLVDKNFDGLYSLKELHLDGNYIRSMISASFRHIQQLEILSLRDNLIDGESNRFLCSADLHETATGPKTESEGTKKGSSQIIGYSRQ